MQSLPHLIAGAVALATLISLARAQNWAEADDAGNLPSTAQAPLGTGPLLTIGGSVVASGDLDIYMIQITNEALFNATTIAVGPTLGDTQLFLLDAMGRGVTCNDDEPLGSARSRIDSTNVTANGTYFLAVSGYNRDPSANGVAIFPNTRTGQILPTLTTPMNGTTAATSSTGTYTITLLGCAYVLTTHAEIADAGELLHSAQAPCKVGPLTRITGSLGANDTDLYRIYIDTPASFLAATCTNTAFDTQLFLFDANGLGVVVNDDFCNSQSTLDNTLVTTAGVYHLAVSRYNRDALSAGGLIFPNTFTGQNGPTGVGGGQPLLSWTGTTFGGVTYEINLTGCSHAAAATAIDYGTGAGSLPGVPGLTTTWPPQLGASTSLTLSNPDASASTFALALGLSRANIPFVHGSLLIGDFVNIFTFPAPTVGNNAIGPINVPSIPDFCGGRVTWQIVVAVSPSGPSISGLTLTNGTEWRFGL